MPDPDERIPVEHEPSEEEAEAEKEETVMPWFWGGVGILVIAAFIAWAIFGKALSPPPAAPVYPVQGAPAHPS